MAQSRKQICPKEAELPISSSEAMAVLDSNGVIQWASPSIFNLPGFHPNEIEGLKIFSFLYWRSTKTLKTLFREYQEHRQMRNLGQAQLFGLFFT